jgi:hypothetical protein
MSVSATLFGASVSVSARTFGGAVADHVSL